MNQKNKIIFLSSLIIGVLTLTLGVTFAIFTFNKTSTNSKLIVGDIYMHYNETNQISLENAMPSDTYNSTNYFEFTIDGKNTTTNKDIWYEIVLTHGDNHATRTTRIRDDLLKFRLVEVKGGVETVVVDNQSYSDLTSKRIWVNTIPKNTSSDILYTYRLYMWISNDTIIGNVNQDYTMEEWDDVYASIKVNVTGDFNEKDVYFSTIFRDILKNKITTITDDDGTIYISGADYDNAVASGESYSEYVDYNYVWYSGKLWRITAIYPDGTMKMITDDAITTISYNSSDNVNFYTDNENKSYMYQWLNEDFLDTLYNYENIIVTDSKWNSLTITSISTKITEGASGVTTTTSPVGLLNSYEYYMSYKNTSFGSGYLNIGYYWWLLNPYYTSYVSRVGIYGDPFYYSPTESLGGRPSVNLKSGIQLSGGSGTKTDPYTILGDKEEVITGTTLLNTRSSGEYVKFNNELYRIVSIENNITKINKNDYVKDTSNNVLMKKFSTSVTYGGGTSDDYWDYYLNNTWYNALDPSYQNMIVESTYYIGTNTGSTGYKASICATASNTVTTKDCTKTTSVWTGKVGLPRYGEMFASQQGSGESSSSLMWLMNPYNTSGVWDVSYSGNVGYGSPTESLGGRPSINLKSSIKITGGKGTKEKPFEISE